MITNFNIGDIFVKKNSGTLLIVPCGYATFQKNQKYSFAGLDGLELWSCFGEKGATKEEVLSWLNNGGYKFSMNINDKIKKSLEFCNNMENNKD